jgi:hypothetical protein
MISGGFTNAASEFSSCGTGLRKAVGDAAGERTANMFQGQDNFL